MTFIGEKDFGLEVSLGNVPGYDRIFKFGIAADVDTAITTDLWDGADGVISTKVWVAPTAARIHDLVSTDAADASAGTGARTVLVFGLTSWDTKETTEIVTLDGLTNVPTVNSYVIIHRMLVLTFGASETNAGVITATAQTDGTITAAITAGRGQTLMAIHGTPSVQNLCITAVNLSLSRTTGAGTANVVLSAQVKSNPQNSDSGYVLAGVIATSQATGAVFEGPRSFLRGPVLVKLAADSDSNNTGVAGSFNAYLVDI